jgi:hypothetical protein
MKTELLGEAKVAIATAKSTLPDLVWQGMAVKETASTSISTVTKHGKCPKNTSKSHVATTIAYLRECCIPTKAPKSNSYWLKHLAEDWGRRPRHGPVYRQWRTHSSHYLSGPAGQGDGRQRQCPHWHQTTTATLGAGKPTGTSRMTWHEWHEWRAFPLYILFQPSTRELKLMSTMSTMPKLTTERTA